LTATGGNVDPTTVYVRLAETTVPGTYSGNITLSGDGASSQLVSVAASTVIKADQTITFGSLANITFGNAGFTLGATANSGLTVSYTSSDPLVATVVGDTVNIVGAGTTTITASQAGNTNFNAATSVQQTLTVNKANQTITFGALPLKSNTDVAFSPGATATSGLSVNYTSSDPNVAIATGNTVTIVGAGTTTITASQSGNDNYNAASTVSQSLTVRSTIAKWTFDTLTGTTTASSTANLSADIGAGTGVGVHAAASAWNFVSGNGSTGALSGNTWASNDYFQFTVNASAYEDIFIQWDQARSSTGPTSFKLQYSTDGSSFTDVSGATALSIKITGTGGSFVFSDGSTGSSWTTAKYATDAGFAIDLSSISQIEKQNTLVFRIVSTVTPASGGTTRIDNVTISGVGVPTISTTGTLSAVTSTYGIASPTTSFSLSGIFLTTGVTVTPPAGFEVSTASDFSSNVGTAASPLVVGAAGTVASTPIYVRLPATAAPATYSGNIVLTSAGASPVNVATVASTMGYASVDGATVSQNFQVSDLAVPLSQAAGWSSNDPTFRPDGYANDSLNAGNTLGYVGGFVNAPANATTQLTYNFTPGNSNRYVFQWNQNITTSSNDFPGDDVFGWRFLSGANTAFSIRFLNDDSTGRDLLVQGYDGAGNALTLGSGQPNDWFIDRNDPNDFRVTADLENKKWALDVFNKANSTWFGLVANANIDPTLSTLDGIAATWSVTDTTFDPDAGQYLGAGDNIMSFDDLTIQGKQTVVIALNLPGSNPTYNGLPKTITPTTTPSGVAVVVKYNGSTTPPVNAGTYTVTAEVVDTTTYYSAPTSGLLIINQAPLTVTGVSADDKEYDGSTSVTLNTAGAAIVGRVGTDDVDLDGTATGVFTDKDVGTNIPVTVTGFTLTGAAAGNYALTQPIPDADITAKELTVIGAAANNKVYDRTDAATIDLTGASLDGVVSPDVVTVNGGGTFISVDVGPGISVTANLSLGGADAGNYTLAQPTYLTAEITAKEVTVPDAQALNKDFDGSSAAVITGTLFGVLPGDTVTLNGGGIFASNGPGTGIAVTPLLYLDGASSGNYFLTQPSGLTADINQTTTPAEDYLSSYGLTGADAALTADPDGDGLNNAAEFAFGTNPVAATGTPVTVSDSGSNVTITFLGRTTGVDYVVKTTTDLSVAFSGSSAPTASSPQPSGLPAGYTQYEASVDTTSGERNFLKVDATLQ